jgi:hypothetical protein
VGLTPSQTVGPFGSAFTVSLTQTVELEPSVMSPTRVREFS